MIVGIVFMSFLAVSSPKHDAQAMSAQTSSTHHCQCTEFVKSYYHLPVIPYDAGSWIQALPIATHYQWTQDSGISRGDIAVWGYSTTAPHGHVAIVSNIDDSSQGIVVTFLGANQVGSRFHDLQCNNASYWPTSEDWSAAVYFHR